MKNQVREGELAYRGGKTRDSNPYVEGGKAFQYEAELWFIGWDVAYQQDWNEAFKESVEGG